MYVPCVLELGGIDDDGNDDDDDDVQCVERALLLDGFVSEQPGPARHTQHYFRTC